MVLERPSAEIVDYYIAQFYEGEKSSTFDKALKLLFEQFPNNNQFEFVLLKVTTLNTLYATGILGIYEVAQRIFQLSIDQRLSQGDLSLVEDLAHVEYRNGHTRRNYSFATKYCSWHNPIAFPIYDSYVDYILWQYQKRFRFANFFRYELFNSYLRFVAVLSDFQTFFELENYSLKQLDNFLWGYGYELLNAEVKS